MSDMAGFFGSAMGFFMSVLGSGLIAIGLSVPITCYRLTGGGWVKCPTANPCPGLSSSGFETSRCENILGLDALADQQGTATVAALGIAALCGLIAYGGGKAAQSGSTTTV